MTDRRNPLTFRCAVPDDEVFLFELYASTRNEEMAAWGWDRAQEQMFLNLQFTAQRRHYDIAFPNAEHKSSSWIIVRSAESLSSEQSARSGLSTSRFYPSIAGTGSELHWFEVCSKRRWRPTSR